MTDRSPALSFDFDALFGQTSAAMLLLEDNSRVLHVNAAAARLFRMTVGELTGQYWAGLDGQLNLFTWKKRLQELTRIGNFTYQTDLVTADELLRPVTVEMVRVGENWTLLTVSNDLADVIDEADLELLSDEGRVGFWMYNRVDEVLYLSGGLRRMLEVPTEEYTVDDVRRLQQHLLPDDWERARAGIKNLLAEAGAFNLLLHFEGSRGTQKFRLFAQSTGNPLHVTRLFGMLRQENTAQVVPNDQTISNELAVFSIDQAQEMIFWSRPDGTLQYANQVVADRLGFSKAQFVGMEIARFFPAFDDEARQEFWKELRAEKAFTAEFTLTGQQGQQVDISANVNYLRFGSEEFACSFCRDITSLNRQRRRQLLTEYTVDNSREMIVWSRPGGIFFFANKTFQQRTGYRWEEIAMMKTPDFFPHLTAEYLAGAWDQLRSGETLEAEIVMINKKGKKIPVQSRISYAKFDGEEFNCVYLRDLTKKKKRDAEMYLMHEALDTAADCILWLDAKHQIRYVNETLLGLISKTRLELYGKPHTIIFPLLPEENIVNQDSMSVTLRTVKREDRKLDLNCSVINASGKEYYMLVGRDITDIDGRQRELEAAYEEISGLKDRLEEDNINLREEYNVNYNVNNIITVSKKYQKVLNAIGQVADVDTTVLITGETGTGKELLARAIHQLSERADAPLIKVNCAALPENLIESELFGHEKGAFTGAVGRKRGRFEIAHQGTLFLDEVGELPLELQSKLLRVLQEDEFERLGGTETIKVDVRLVAATNRDLEEMVRKGSFRADLYYRLNVFPIHNMALRERPEDIPVLVEHFAKKFAKQQNKDIRKINNTDMKRLRKYHFPGNIRELENLVERAVVLSTSEVLTIPFDNKKGSGVVAEDEKFLTLEDMQRKHIIAALKRTSGRVTGPSGAGILLGMNDRTLVSRMRKLNIRKIDYLE